MSHKCTLHCDYSCEILHIFPSINHILTVQLFLWHNLSVQQGLLHALPKILGVLGQQIYRHILSRYTEISSGTTVHLINHQQPYLEVV